MRVQVDFLHIDKYKNLLQVDFVVLVVVVRHAQSTQGNNHAISFA